MRGKYSCPHCDQHVVVDDAPPGLIINCPNCGTGFALAVQSSRRGLLKSPLYWGVVMAAALAIPVTMYLVDRSRTGKPKTTVAKSESASPVRTAGVGLIEGRTVDAWVDEFEINKGGTEEAKLAHDVFKRAGESVIPGVLQIYNDPKTGKRRRGNALQSLGFTGVKDSTVEGVLWNALKETDPYARYSAIYSLGRLNLDPEKLAPQFTEMLDDPDSSVRRSAADNLGNLGDFAQAAIPKLEGLLNDEVKTTRDKAAAAIKKINAAKPVTQNNALNVQLRALSSKEFAVRYEARMAIQRMGHDLVPELMRMLADTSLDVQHRWHAAEALAYTGDKNGPEIALLTDSLKDSDRLVRANALEALWRIKIEPKELIPICVSMLGDPDKEVRRRAAVGLGNLRSEAMDAVPALQKATTDQNESARAAAIEALAKITREPPRPTR